MCQGLPCINAIVQLRGDILSEGARLKSGKQGVVVREHLATREVEILFEHEGRQHQVRVHEDDIAIVRRPLQSPDA